MRWKAPIEGPSFIQGEFDAARVSLVPTGGNRLTFRPRPPHAKVRGNVTIDSVVWKVGYCPIDQPLACHVHLAVTLQSDSELLSAMHKRIATFEDSCLNAKI